MLKEYLDKMLILHSIDSDILKIGKEEYRISDVPFDKNFNIRNDNEDVVYYFMGRWYFHKEGTEFSLNELKNIGEVNQKNRIDTFLGIHSGYEILSGIGMYKDWIAKAKFLGVKNLGICEKNTLSGVMEFQTKCKSVGIKPIFGMMVEIDDFNVSLYVKNFEGWLNLLKFNSKINVVGGKITMDFLRENKYGLFVIADPKTMEFGQIESFDFFKLDTVSFVSEEKDDWYVENLQKFIESDLDPVLLSDAYYINADDYDAREFVMKVGKEYDDKSTNQYFKNIDQIESELYTLYGGGGYLDLLEEAVENIDFVGETCNFEYDTSNRHLPKYKMTSAELGQFETNEELLHFLIAKGIENTGIENNDEVNDRINLELNVLKKGDVIDYFLTLYDIVNFAKRSDILVGIARGSAGGSLIAYLLGIIHINPLEYGLLFERFLNEGRMGDLVECKAYKINDKITLNEKSLVKIVSGSIEKTIFVEDLKEGDEIIEF